jgi:dTDP-glucose pyrophosphorylase
LSARGDEVRIALIPVAGWQARVLASEVVERMLVPALHEVSQAGIREVTLIVAPGAASAWTLRQRFPALTIRTLEQNQSSGLGRALLLGRPDNYYGPVGVVLPDEVDRSGQALGELARQYRVTNRCLVAVNPSPAEKEKRGLLRYYGIAVLKQRRISGQSQRVHELQEPLMEKRHEPQGFPRNSRKIAGRYVLTPEIFDSIELTGPELTAALNEHWLRLYAFELRRDLVALSPYQEILEVIDSIKSA